MADCPTCNGDAVLLDDDADGPCPACHGWGTLDHPRGCGADPCMFPQCGPMRDWSCPGWPGREFWTGGPEMIEEGPF